MGCWKKAILILLVVMVIFINSCYPKDFGHTIFFTEYIPQELPEDLPEWWKVNLTQYLNLSYIDSGTQAAFGALGGDIFRPNLYATYATVGILENLSVKIENSSNILEWINSLQEKSGTYYDKETLAPPIEQTYWAIYTIKRLKSVPSNTHLILQFLKNHERKDGLFIFNGTNVSNLTESCISQTYFAISILHLLDVNSDVASKSLNLKALSKTLQSYIEEHISSNYPLLKDEKSGYIISAIYELGYISKDSVPKKAYSWLSSKVKEISALNYDVLNIALINNLFEALEMLGIAPKDRRIINNYLEKEVFPNQNTQGGFSFDRREPVFIEPMITYEVVKLFKTSSISCYPNIDKLVENLKIHRIKSGWIKYITFKPSVEATYYAVLLTTENGNIKDFHPDLVVKYLISVIEDIRKFTIENNNINGVKVVEISEVNDKLETLYYAIKTYTFLEKHLPMNLKLQLIDMGNSFAKILPSLITKNDLFFSAKSLAHFISIFNTLQLWPSNNFGLLNEIKEVSDRLVYTIKHDKVFDIKMLYYMFVLSSILRLNNYSEANKNLLTIENALLILNSKNGFKRSLQINTPDIDSTYLGLWIESMSGNIQLHSEETIKFVMESMDTYGFNYTPQKENSFSNLKVTYEALWILNFLTTGWKFNFSFHR